MKPVNSKIRQVLKVLRHEGISGIKKLIRLKLAKAVHFNGTYSEWINSYDSLNELTRNRIRKKILHLPQKPLISIVLPVYNPPTEFLSDAIDSVLKQLYPYWELCIADDASTDPDIISLLANYARKDDRIKVLFRKENGHISKASNSALGLATGDFVALLDHDDKLSEHALYFIAEAINQNPKASLIYSDEDKIDESGKRSQPHFKCDFNYELFLAQNMICHLCVFKHSLLAKVGGFRVGYEGSQDYDLILRILDYIDFSEIVHVPRILYHWRAIAGSTALDCSAKSYAAEAGRKAVYEHLQRCGTNAEVTPAPESPSHNRVHFPLPDPLPLVSIIIPTRDRVDLLSVCVHSILERTSYSNYEIIIIDNGSTETGTLNFFNNLPGKNIQVFRDESAFNFSALNNYGAHVAQGEMICLMNNDIEILTPDWLKEMVSFAHRPEIGCVGARLWYPSGLLQHGGVIIGIGGVAGHAHLNRLRGDRGYFNRAVLHQSLSAVTAACLLIRREVFEQVGGLDESLAVAFNDVDFCLRVREAGYRNVWTPYAEMIHHESATRGYETTPEKQARFTKEVQFMKERWGNKLLIDPAYNPNLSLDELDFSYAFPPRY
jgi:O-antigen biosynthesis protein